MANSASFPFSSMAMRATAPTRASPGGSGSAATRANSVFGLIRVILSAMSVVSSFSAYRKRWRTSSGSSREKLARIGSASSGRIGRISTSRPLGRRILSCQGGSRSRAAMGGYWHTSPLRRIHNLHKTPLGGGRSSAGRRGGGREWAYERRHVADLAGAVAGGRGVGEMGGRPGLLAGRQDVLRDLPARAEGRQHEFQGRGREVL